MSPGRDCASTFFGKVNYCKCQSFSLIVLFTAILAWFQNKLLGVVRVVRYTRYLCVFHTLENHYRGRRFYQMSGLLLASFTLIGIYGHFTHPAFGADDFPSIVESRSLDSDGQGGRDQSFSLPSLQTHPLPDFLATWEDLESQGDYFEAITPTIVGYLVWPRFPITVFVESPAYAQTLSAPSTQASFTGELSTELPHRFDAFEHDTRLISTPIHNQWYDAVLQAIDEWSDYIPLELDHEAETADISIWATAPPLQIDTRDSEILLGRARSAETRYEFYISDHDDGTRTLMPRYEIMIKRGQAPQQILSTARHEIGHALGLWGHSPLPTDALY